MNIAREDFVLTDEPHRFDVPAIASLIQGTYWAAHRTVEQAAELLTHSTCLVLTLGGKTIGFVRAISDHSVNSFICGFIVSPDYQQQRQGIWMLGSPLAHKFSAQ